MGRIQSGQCYRLPTDAEWSIAAGLAEAGNIPGKKSRKIPGYIWGDQWPPPPGGGNYGGAEAVDATWPFGRSPIHGYRDDFPRTSPVGSFMANRYGLYDMGGNVWQWCEDHMDAHSHGRVARGASWYDVYGVNAFTSTRWSFQQDYRSTSVGFRCVFGTVAPRSR